jgi:protease PrsW
VSSAIVDNKRFTIVVWSVVLLGALALTFMFVQTGQPRILALTALLAAVPVGPIVACYLWLDRYEPEPRNLLIGAVLWGAFGATVAAMLLQIIGGSSIGISRNGMLAVVAPITEEATKGLFLLLMLWWRRHELDGILDGIVYAGLVGVGFAFIENILYLSAAYTGSSGIGTGGAVGLTGIFVVRCLLSPFAHPMFTTFIGLGVGVAVHAKSRLQQFVAPLLGYAMAVSAHAIWNGSTLYGGERFILVYLTLMAPAFLMLIALAIWWRRTEQKMLTISLYDAAQRGFLPESDIRWLANLSARRLARVYASSYGGESSLSVMKEYQQAAIELAFLHHRYLRGTAPRDFLIRGQEFVNRMHALRPHLRFPDGVSV